MLSELWTKCWCDQAFDCSGHGIIRTFNPLFILIQSFQCLHTDCPAPSSPVLDIYIQCVWLYSRVDVNSHMESFCCYTVNEM